MPLSLTVPVGAKVAAFTKETWTILFSVGRVSALSMRVTGMQDLVSPQRSMRAVESISPQGSPPLA